MSKFLSLFQAAILALLLAMPGCTDAAPRDGGRGDADPGQGGFTFFMPPDEERRVTREEHPKILARFGGAYEDPQFTAYVAGIGAKLARAAGGLNHEIRVTVLNSPVVNAFALPGGYVYITRGLAALANNEAELASVLAHEIGHVAARHTAERYSQAVALSLGAAALGALFDNPAFGQVAEIGGELYLLSFSRDQEFGADSLSVRYLAQAGYPPIASAAFLESLSAHSALEDEIAGEPGGEREIDFFATHPRTADRVVRAAAEAGPPAARPFFGRDVYLDRIDGMIYGDDPAQGFVRGRRFLHPVMRITFEAPPGFRLINTSTAVVALGPEDSVIQFDNERDPAKLRAARGPVDYLTRIWASDIRLREVEPIDVNGMAAATGRGRMQGKSGRVDVRLVAIASADGAMYRMIFLTKPQQTERLEESFRRATYSFRALSAAEASRLRPLRLAVRPVEPTDSEDRFAAAMPFGEWQLRRFRVLNGLREGERIEPGQRVKMIRSE